MMHRFGTTIGCFVFALLLVFPASAQDVQEVTVREINAIPQENIDELQALGADVTVEDMERLIESPYAGERVQFTGVVLAEPRNSGLASVDDDDGMPGRVHFFVRDTSAATQGAGGMDIQIVDGSYQEKGLLGLFRGDVVTITGDVTYFGYGLQITPETVEFIGDYEGLGLPESLLDPVSVTTADIHKNMGTALVQTNWENFNDLNQQYVRIEDATVWRSPNRTDDRPDWAITTDGTETILQNDDLSLCFRNDKNDYPDSFNQDCIEGEFEAPPPGARVNVEGFALLRSDWDPFNIGAPSEAMMKIVPWEEGDVEVTAQPSITSVAFDTLNTVVGNEPIDVTINVEGDLDAVETANLYYQTSNMADADTLELTDQGDGAFSTQIEAQDEGTFITFSGEITDVNGSPFLTPSAMTTRVLYDGVDEIKDLQETWEEIGSGSPFEDQTIPMNITATVQSDPSTSELIVVQDDSERGMWSGILISDTEEIIADLQRGDVINITSATVVENFDVTELRDVTYEKQSSGDPIGYEVVTTDILTDEAIAEAYEGMMVRFEEPIITNADAGFGEWEFSSDGSEENAVRADDASVGLSSDFNESLSRWEKLEYLQGVWWFSFGDYKLLPESPDDVGEATNVAAEDEELPGTFALGQNYPNPFNPVTSIEFSVPRSGNVTLELFDMLGRSVEMLVNEERPAGTYTVRVDGEGLSSGVYIYRLTAGDETSTRKMILMK